METKEKFLLFLNSPKFLLILTAIIETIVLVFLFVGLDFLGGTWVYYTNDPIVFYSTISVFYLVRIISACFFVFIYFKGYTPATRIIIFILSIFPVNYINFNLLIHRALIKHGAPSIFMLIFPICFFIALIAFFKVSISKGNNPVAERYFVFYFLYSFVLLPIHLGIYLLVK
jgi:hypothetical protein